MDTEVKAVGNTPEIGENGNWFIDGEDTGYPAVARDGVTPTVGENGNWWLGDLDTGVPAKGQDGETPYIGSNGNWWIGDEDTGYKAAGDDGEDGEDGLTPEIGENGNWWIGDLNTMVKAAGQEGLTPHIGENGNWWLGDNDTGHRAIGLDGKDGADGVTPRLKIGGDGLWYVSYDNGDRWESLNVQAVGVKGEKGDKGDKGDQGEAGEDGKDGTVAAGIDGAQINEEGDLILTLADGTTINAGRVRDDQDNSEPENAESTPPAIGASTVVAICLAGASLLGIEITLTILLIRKRGR